MAASGTYKDPNTGVTTTQTHVTRSFAPRTKDVKTQAPDFAAGFTGAEAMQEGPRQMIASREIKYNRERRKAADAKGLESQKQSGQLQRASMVARTSSANQAAQRKENKLLAGMQNRFSTKRDAQQRQWDVQERDIKAKQVRAAGTAKGRSGALSDKNRYDMSMNFKKQIWDVGRPEEYYDWNQKKQAEYDQGMKPAFDNYLKSMGVGQVQQPVVEPTVQPTQPQEQGSGTYRVGSGQTIDVNTGLPVGQVQQPVVEPTVQPTQPQEQGSGTYRVGSGQTIDVNTGLPVGQSPERIGDYMSPGYPAGAQRTQDRIIGSETRPSPLLPANNNPVSASEATAPNAPARQVTPGTGYFQTPQETSDSYVKFDRNAQLNSEIGQEGEAWESKTMRSVGRSVKSLPSKIMSGFKWGATGGLGRNAWMSDKNQGVRNWLSNPYNIQPQSRADVFQGR